MILLTRFQPGDKNESDWKWLFLAKMAESGRIHYVENETSYELVIPLTLTGKCTFYLVIHIFRMSKPNGNGQICKKVFFVFRFIIMTFPDANEEFIFIILNKL